MYEEAMKFVNEFKQKKVEEGKKNGLGRLSQRREGFKYIKL